jgi:hypothetical protein
MPPLALTDPPVAVPPLALTDPPVPFNLPPLAIDPPAFCWPPELPVLESFSEAHADARLSVATRADSAVRAALLIMKSPSVASPYH